MAARPSKLANNGANKKMVGVKRLNIIMEIKEHRALKQRAVDADTTMSEIVKDALDLYYSKNS